jgi:hypothetical protein
MSAPGRKNIELWRGNSETLHFRLKNKDGTPFILTGSVLTFRLTHEKGVLVKTIGNGLVIGGTDTNEIFISITPAETRLISDGQRVRSVYELERKIELEERTILTGNVTMMGGNNAD